MADWWLINEQWRILKFITCIWPADSSFSQAAEFHWCYRGEPRNFICVAAVSRGIYEIRRGICQILPRKSVGPNDNINFSRYFSQSSRVADLC